jgi:hypothetical protein
LSALDATPDTSSLDLDSYECWLSLAMLSSKVPDQLW